MPASLNLGIALKKILVLFVLLLLFGPAQAADVTYRVIGGAEHWQGVVELSQPILVAAGAELTIAPGTQIKVAEKELAIRVEGRLLAVGRADQPIRFLAPSGWRGIELYQSDGMNRFEYVRIALAEVGLSSSLSRFEMKQSRFSQCATAIKLHRQTSPLIEETEFAGNQIALAIGTRSQVVLRENRFHDNVTAVVASHNSSGTLSGNHFVENRQGVHLRHLFPGKLSGNTFERNETAILCDQTMTSPLVERNRFIDNQQGVVCLLASKPQLQLNLFRGNVIALLSNQLGSPLVKHNSFIANGVAIQSERRAAPQIERNRFEKNDLALFCDYLSYPQVKQNNFVANLRAVKLGDHQSAEMEKQGGSEQQMLAFIRETGRSGKLAVFNSASGVLDVSNNWWGAESNQESVAELFVVRQQDKWVLDDTTGERYLRDRISFSPWLQQPVADAGIEINK